ncbi:hypothetical protein DDZ13_08870 [Coraliomargarita sinensis]|uniref:Uncharacterized protein n=1 Tax=Coraliomargarita sinensis TaxID=2174842 RepID=A0A317ZL92_9BACT|nr:hypothetical protein [Coraliomargarita sinensis]PXA04141.1 hypothetical protein DDZ13_08870 [Coraliomargarita sinensis]
MKLTPAEELALRKIERQELQFQKWKKILVVECVVMVAVGVWFMNLLGDIPENYKESLEMQAVIYSAAIPMLYFFCGMTGYLIGMTLKNWKGNPERVLILGILKRSQAYESEPADGDNVG